MKPIPSDLLKSLAMLSSASEADREFATESFALLDHHSARFATELILVLGDSSERVRHNAGLALAAVAPSRVTAACKPKCMAAVLLAQCLGNAYTRGRCEGRKISDMLLQTIAPTESFLVAAANVLTPQQVRPLIAGYQVMGEYDVSCDDDSYIDIEHRVNPLARQWLNRLFAHGAHTKSIATDILRIETDIPLRTSAIIALGCLPASTEVVSLLDGIIEEISDRELVAAAQVLGQCGKLVLPLVRKMTSIAVDRRESDGAKALLDAIPRMGIEAIGIARKLLLLNARSWDFKRAYDRLMVAVHASSLPVIAARLSRTFDGGLFVMGLVETSDQTLVAID